MPEEVQSEDKNKYKAPPEDLEAVERHWRKPSAEEIKEAEEFAQKITRQFGYGARLTNEEKELASAWQQESAYRNNNDNAGLAHVLIVQGRFAEAMSIDPARQAECEQLITARDRDDNERCACAARQIEKVSVPSENVVKKQWIPERNKFCWLIRCGQCGQMNFINDLHQDIADFHFYRLEKMQTKE